MTSTFSVPTCAINLSSHLVTKIRATAERRIPSTIACTVLCTIPYYPILSLSTYARFEKVWKTSSASSVLLYRCACSFETSKLVIGVPDICCLILLNWKPWVFGTSLSWRKTWIPWLSKIPASMHNAQEFWNWQNQIRTPFTCWVSCYLHHSLVIVSALCVLGKKDAKRNGSEGIKSSRRLSPNPTMNCPYPNCVRWSNRSFDLRLACNVVQSRKPMNLSSRHISTIWHDHSHRKDHTRLFKSL